MRRRAALVLGVVGLGVLALPVAAGAAEGDVEVYGGGGTVVTVPGDPGDPGDPADPGDPDDPATLPFTGGDAAGLALIGVGAVGAGLVVSRVRRTRHV